MEATLANDLLANLRALQSNRAAAVFLQVGKARRARSEAGRAKALRMMNKAFAEHADARYHGDIVAKIVEAFDAIDAYTPKQILDINGWMLPALSRAAAVR